VTGLAPPREVVDVHRLLDVIAFHAEVAGTHDDPEMTMRLATERAQLATAADGAAIELADGEEMVYRVVSGCASGSLGLRLRLDSSLSGLATRTGEVQSCMDSEQDARVDREACRRIGLRSMLCVPLVHRDRSIGVLKVMSGRVAAFDETDTAVLRLLAAMVASAMTQAQLIENLEKLARTDPLTSLPNRRAFEEMAERYLALARRRGSTLSVAIIDLDHFKRFNDTHGHPAGDRLLRTLAQRWSECLREGDVLARWGGEEFTLLLPDCSVEEALDVCSRLRAATPDPQTFSAGLVTGDGGCSLPDFVAAADAALYDAKRRGRGRVVIGGMPLTATA
jgi:diguanylate cyclase